MGGEGAILEPKESIGGMLKAIHGLGEGDNGRVQHLLRHCGTFLSFRMPQASRLRQLLYCDSKPPYCSGEQQCSGFDGYLTVCPSAYLHLADDVYRYSLCPYR